MKMTQKGRQLQELWQAKKNEDDLIMKMTLKMDMVPKMRRCFPLEGKGRVKKNSGIRLF